MSLRTIFTAATAIVVAAGVLADSASATAPGENGSITFRRYLGPDRTKGAIFTIAPDGKRERQLTRPPGELSDDFPDFASDGSFVAFQRCNATCAVFTVRANGTRLRRVGPACTGHRLPPRCSESAYPAISPNRKRIAFEHAFGEIRDDQIDHVGIYVMRSNGSQVRRVTLPPTRAAEDIEPQWSPDGRRIVFTRFNVTAEPAGQAAIFTVKADGTDLRQVTPWDMNAGDGPDWSPDGSEILFRAPQTEDFLNSNVYAIHPDGTSLRQITNVAPATKIYSSSYSPDGRSITFGMTGVDGAADVFTMNADGTGIKPVTRTPLWDSAPDWGGMK